MISSRRGSIPAGPGARGQGTLFRLASWWPVWLPSWRAGRRPPPPGAPPLIYERCRVRAEPGIVLVVRWETVREGRVPIETHAELACLLRAAYPHFPNFFAGTRSWSYVRPELRVICWADESAIATAGALRRFIEVGGKDHLVAIVGLVAVHPERQRARLGVALMEAVADALDDLDVPFGLLMCAPWHVSFYQRAGWHLLSPRRVCYSPDDTADPRPFVDEIAHDSDGASGQVCAHGVARWRDELA